MRVLELEPDSSDSEAEAFLHLLYAPPHGEQDAQGKRSMHSFFIGKLRGSHILRRLHADCGIRQNKENSGS